MKNAFRRLCRAWVGSRDLFWHVRHEFVGEGGRGDTCARNERTFNNSNGGGGQRGAAKSSWAGPRKINVSEQTRFSCGNPPNKLNLSLCPATRRVNRRRCARKIIAFILFIYVCVYIYVHARTCVYGCGYVRAGACFRFEYREDPKSGNDNAIIACRRRSASSLQTPWGFGTRCRAGGAMKARF